MVKIHQTAIVNDKAILGANISIGAYAIIEQNVIIGENSVIEPHCHIGYKSHTDNFSTKLILGKNSLVRSKSILYESSVFGDFLVTGHNVVVRENTIAGKNFQIGSNTEIQGDCTIGEYVKFQSGIFVAKKTIIKNYVWVLPNVIFTNDPTPPSNDLIGSTINDFAVICAGSTILPGLNIGKGAVVGAMSCVTKDVRDNYCVVGNPAVEKKPTKEIKRRLVGKEPAYPWTKHFTRGYTKEMVDKWSK